MVKSIFRAHDFEKDCCKEEVSTHLVCECNKCFKKLKYGKIFLMIFYYGLTLAFFYASAKYFMIIDKRLFVAVSSLVLSALFYHALNSTYDKFEQEYK